jgi:hypothetical protein
MPARAVRAVSDEGADLPPGHGDVCDHQVALGDHVVNLPMQLVVGLAQPQGGGVKGGGAGAAARGRFGVTLPVAGVRMHDLLEVDRITVGHDLHGAGAEGLELVGGGNCGRHRTSWGNMECDAITLN